VDVTVVDDGSAAVEKLVGQRDFFDLAFFDINRPIMGGVKALSKAGGLLRTNNRPSP
jgi:CheY-like chemotaxis protein